MEFNLVQTTTRAPFNRCYLCDDHLGPFVDCFKDQHGHGAVYVCAPIYDANAKLQRPGCVGQMAKLAGMLYRHESFDQAAKITELQARVTELMTTQRVEMTFGNFLELAEKYQQQLDDEKPKEPQPKLKASKYGKEVVGAPSTRSGLRSQG